MAAAAKEGKLKIVSGKYPEKLGKPYLFGGLSKFIATLAADFGGKEACPGKGPKDEAGGGFREPLLLGKVASGLELIRLFC